MFMVRAPRAAQRPAFVIARRAQPDVAIYMAKTNRFVQIRQFLHTARRVVAPYGEGTIDDS